MQDLTKLAELIRRRTEIDLEITSILGRPAFQGHFGEYVAAAVFGIELNPSASAKGDDGRFIDGPLAGKSVNIKYYTKRTGLLDIVNDWDPAGHPNYYLVLTGPIGGLGSSKGTSAPWTVTAVYLFETGKLLADQSARGVKLGIAASVRRSQWGDAKIYPDAANPLLILTPEQRDALALFSDFPIDVTSTNILKSV